MLTVVLRCGKLRAQSYVVLKKLEDAMVLWRVNISFATDIWRPSGLKITYALVPFPSSTAEHACQ